MDLNNFFQTAQDQGYSLYDPYSNPLSNVGMIQQYLDNGGDLGSIFGLGSVGNIGPNGTYGRNFVNFGTDGSIGSPQFRQIQERDDGWFNNYMPYLVAAGLGAYGAAGGFGAGTGGSTAALADTGATAGGEGAISASMAGGEAVGAIPGTTAAGATAGTATTMSQALNTAKQGSTGINLLNNLLGNNSGNKMADSSLLGSLLNAYISDQGNSNQVDNAQRIYDQNVALGQKAADQGKFTPYNVSTNFGNSDGNNSFLSPQMQNLLGQYASQQSAAGSNLASIGYDPNAYANSIYNRYKAGVADSQKAQFDQLQEQLNRQGLLGLKTFSNSNSGMATNPFYKDFAAGVASQDNTAYNNAMQQSNSMYSNLLNTLTNGQNGQNGLAQILQGLQRTSLEGGALQSRQNLEAASLPMKAGIGSSQALLQALQSRTGARTGLLNNLLGNNGLSGLLSNNNIGGLLSKIFGNSSSGSLNNTVGGNVTGDTGSDWSTSGVGTGGALGDTGGDWSDYATDWGY